LSHEYLRLQGERGEVFALRQRVNAQDETIAAFETRVAEVRRDVATWRSLHDDMWAALAATGDKNAEPTGIGGGMRPSIMRIAPAIPRPPIEELDRLAGTMAAEGPRLRQLTDLVGRMGKLMSTLPLRWPVQGRINSEFGDRISPWNGRPERHGGLDIGAPMGTPVMSPAAGTVTLAGSGGGFGKHVKMDHGNGVRSLYGHLSRLDVKTGDHVEKGQVIGLVGSTGHSTGPHLHYEIRVDGKRVDPRTFLPNA
jgi:murein DD-endopeptidase MepM/ murein hydrolase activator NlpD